MALSDAEREKTKKRNKPKAMTADGNFRWSDQQKLDLVKSYLAVGNLALVARIHGVPEVTARVWKASEWWSKVVDELRMQEKIELSNKMKKLVEASQLIVAQRLEQGDPVLNQKTGEIILKPVSLKDAHKVATDYIDRQKDLDKMTREDSVTDVKNDDKLVKLAERFAEIATKSIEKKKNLEYVEVIEYAVHDERETGLQEGVPEVPFSPGTNQEQDGTDDSSPSS